MPKIRVTMNLPEDVWERAKAAAAARAISASQFAEEALLERLQQRQTEARHAALDRILAMRLPAGTPEEIEAEIERGRFMDRGD